MNAQKANDPKEKVRQLQRKLYRSAKQNRKRKDHALYDKIYLGVLVRFADDIVIICKTRDIARTELKLLLEIMKRLELEPNDEKTKLIQLRPGKEVFDFLGFHHRKEKRVARNGRMYTSTIQFPNKKAMKRMKTAVKDLLGNRSHLKNDIQDMIDQMNLKIRGWRNYYGLFTAQK